MGVGQRVHMASQWRCLVLLVTTHTKDVESEAERHVVQNQAEQTVYYT